VGVLIVLLVGGLAVQQLMRSSGEAVRWTVKQQKQTTAVNLAEAGVERGYWRVKNSLGTFNDVMDGAVLPGYNFDQTHRDVDGGSYRVRIARGNNVNPVSGRRNEVIITAEGRDARTAEIYAVQAVYRHQPIPAPVISQNNVDMRGRNVVHWGPIMAQGNIDLDNAMVNLGFPRKIAAQVVRPYDNNGLSLPNSDDVEWWSGSSDVPEFPELDFARLRQMALNAGTLNCNGTVDPATGLGLTCATPGNENIRASYDVTNAYADPARANPFPSTTGNVWFWDENVTITRAGMRGIFIFRKNLTIGRRDCWGRPPTTTPDYGFPNCDHPHYTNVELRVPEMAWKEYEKKTPLTGRPDTSAVNEYPGDIGLHRNAATYTMDEDNNWRTEGELTGGDLAFYGLVYVGGDANLGSSADIYGAIWVVGDYSGNSENNVIFFDEDIDVPTLNVMLKRRSWRSVAPSGDPWL